MPGCGKHKHGLLSGEDFNLSDSMPTGSAAAAWLRLCCRHSGVALYYAANEFQTVENEPAKPQLRTSGDAPSFRYDAFLCHASEDKASIVVPVADAMRRLGLRPWLDRAEVGWGDPLVGVIQKGLSESQFAIVFISNAFLQKNWPKTELDAALSIEISSQQKKVLPVVLGVDHVILQTAYPFISAKLYKSIAPYNPATPVAQQLIVELVSDLRIELARIGNFRDSIRQQKSNNALDLSTLDPNDTDRFYK